MLKQRLITAAILIPVFVFLLLKLSPLHFAYLTTGFVLLAAWEWSNLMAIKKVFPRLLFVLVIFMLSAFSLLFPTIYLLVVALAWWLIALLLVLVYPTLSTIWKRGILIRGLMGALVLVPTWRALNFIRDSDVLGPHSGPYVLLFLFVLIWGADSGAYFAGKKWGKNKLAPKVSPGKTWEGLGGALMLTLIIAPTLFLAVSKPYPEWQQVIIVSLITVLFSVLGDLFESMLKRNANLKDSGTLFPGHGGLLDRIDSLTAAAPIFALGSLWISKILH